MIARRIGVVVSRFNEEVTSRLRDNCVAALKAGGVSSADITVVEVPGGYEIPWAVNELALSGEYGVLIALGAVLKGRTPQNGHIAASAVASLHEISLRTRVPCILGIITPNTWAQAMARTRGKLDRGREAALAALEMLALRRKLHG